MQSAAPCAGRPKNLYGVHSKLARKGFFATLSEIHDVRALRLIVDSKHDCYAALREVEHLWEPLPRRYKVSSPSSRGCNPSYAFRCPRGSHLASTASSHKMRAPVSFRSMGERSRFGECVGPLLPSSSHQS